MRIKVSQCLNGKWVILGYSKVKEGKDSAQAVDAFTDLLVNRKNIAMHEDESGLSAFFFMPEHGPISLEVVSDGRG